MDIMLGVAVYGLIITLIHKELSHAREKLESSYKYFHPSALHTPTKEQVQEISTIIKQWKAKPESHHNTKKYKHVEINFNRYKRIRRVLIILTLGIFKIFE